MAGSIEDIMQHELAQLNQNMRSLDTDVKDIKSIMIAQYNDNITQQQANEQHARAITQMSEQRAGARQDEFQDTLEASQTETQRQLTDINETSRKTLKIQSDNGRTANEYLNSLMTLTRNNIEEQKRKKEDGILSKIGGRIDELASTYKGYGRQSDTATFAMGNTSQIAKGVKDLFGDFGKGAKWLGNMGTRSREKAIEKDTSAINRIKLQKQAREEEALKLESEGKDEEAKKKRESIDALNAQLERKAESVSKNTSTEYMKQLKKSDKEFKKIDSSDQDLMKSQMKEKMKASLVGGVAQSDRENQSESIASSRRIGNNQNGGANEDIANRNEARAKAAQAEGQLKIGESFLKTPVKSSQNPSTLGQYIGGIYDELVLLNKQVLALSTQANKGVGGGGEEGGGGFSIMKALFGTGLAAIAGGGLLKLGAPLLAKLGMTGTDQTPEDAQKSTEGLEHNIDETGTKVIKTGGLKTVETGLKIAGMAGKAGAKSLAKKIPIVGAAAGLGFGAERIMKEGDWLGGAGEVASGLASTIPFVGTAASVGIDAALLARDFKRARSGETAKALKEHEVSSKGGFGLRKDQGIGSMLGINVGDTFNRVKASGSLLKEGDYSGAAKQYGASLLNGVPLVGAAAANWLGGDPEAAMAQKPTEPQIPPMAQKTVNMQTPGVDASNAKSQIDFAKMQAEMNADAMAKRNMRPDVKNQKVQEIEEAQKPFWKIW